ncbi:hypothetical protein [Brevibacterium linens]|uniref:hypothetical protein n=1 Tax=Brevibacterium linens TaxID=1703 RepID=UPI003BF5727A
MTASNTSRREKNQQDYRRYYEKHPEQTVKDQARQAKYQAESRHLASLHGRQWSETDIAGALNLDEPLKATAVRMGRTYAAVRQARYRQVKKMNLPNSLIKNENDEYTVRLRRTDFDIERVIPAKTRWEALREEAMRRSCV